MKQPQIFTSPFWVCSKVPFTHLFIFWKSKMMMLLAFTRHIHTPMLKRRLDNYFIHWWWSRVRKAVHKCTLNYLLKIQNSNPPLECNCFKLDWSIVAYNGFKRSLYFPFLCNCFKVEIQISLRKCLVNYKYLLVVSIDCSWACPCIDK
jgi:hypothetical protein